MSTLTGLAGLLGALQPLLLSAGPVAPPGVPRAAVPLVTDVRAVHDLHLTHTRLVVEGRTIVCRVRLFHDDLQEALRQFANQPGLALTHAARADSVFQVYWSRTMKLEANGRPLALQVSASGGETDPAGQEVVWYVLEGAADAEVKTLSLMNGLMFELFRDQQNIIQLLRLPGETRKTLYFAATDPRDQKLEFGD